MCYYHGTHLKEGLKIGKSGLILPPLDIWVRHLSEMLRANNKSISEPVLRKYAKSVIKREHPQDEKAQINQLTDLFLKNTALSPEIAKAYAESYVKNEFANSEFYQGLYVKITRILAEAKIDATADEYSIASLNQPKKTTKEDEKRVKGILTGLMNLERSLYEKEGVEDQRFREALRNQRDVIVKNLGFYRGVERLQEIKDPQAELSDERIGGLVLGFEYPDENFIRREGRVHGDNMYLPYQVNVRQIREVYVSPVARESIESVREHFRAYGPYYLDFSGECIDGTEGRTTYFQGRRRKSSNKVEEDNVVELKVSK